MSSFISPEPVAAGSVSPSDPDVPPESPSLAADVRGWADAAEREGRAGAAEVLRRMADNPDLAGASLSEEEVHAVAGSPVSLEELEAAAGRFDRLDEARRLAKDIEMDVEIPTCQSCGSRMEWDDRIVAFLCPVRYKGWNGTTASLRSPEYRCGTRESMSVGPVVKGETL